MMPQHAMTVFWLPYQVLLVKSMVLNHPQVVFVHAKTLEEAKYKLKLSQKVSDEFYSHCNAFPIGGTDQGASNSVAIWIFISSVLFEVHESEAFMMKMTTLNGNLTVQLNLVGFVDDTTACTSGHPSISVSDLLERIQKDAQLWYELLFISGGNLELENADTMSFSTNMINMTNR